MKAYIEAGFKPLPGYQLRYIYFIDPAYRARLTVPEIPYSRIAEVGAAMYRGQKCAEQPKSETGDASSIETGGANPTVRLTSHE